MPSLCFFQRGQMSTFIHSLRGQMSTLLYELGGISDFVPKESVSDPLKSVSVPRKSISVSTKVRFGPFRSVPVRFGIH